MGVVNRAGQRGSQAEIGFSAYFRGQKFSRGVEAPLPGSLSSRLRLFTPSRHSGRVDVCVGPGLSPPPTSRPGADKEGRLGLQSGCRHPLEAPRAPRKVPERQRRCLHKSSTVQPLHSSPFPPEQSPKSQIRSHLCISVTVGLSQSACSASVAATQRQMWS